MIIDITHHKNIYKNKIIYKKQKVLGICHDTNCAKSMTLALSSSTTL